MAALSVEQENYVRISLLLTGVSPKAVRSLFDREFAPSCLTSSIRKEGKKIHDLALKGNINREQLKLLQGSQLESSSFDISLMTCLLRNLTNIQGPKTGYDVLPQPSDQCEGADLARLKYYRNFMAHMTDDKIDNAYFNACVDDICGATERLGGSSLKYECDQRRHGPLDQSNIEIVKEIRSSKIEFAETREDFEDLKDEFQELKEETDVKTDVIQNRIDRIAPASGLGFAFSHNAYKYKTEDFGKHFVRTKSFKEIINAIETHQLVIVTGPPGCGKLINAWHAAHSLKLESTVGRYDCEFDLNLTDFFNMNSIYSSYELTHEAYQTKIHVLREFFGRCSLNEDRNIFWKETIHKIKRILRTKRRKIVLTCRRDMYDTVIKDNLGINAYHCSVYYSKEEINQIYQAYVGTSENLSLPREPSLLALIPAICSFSDCELFLKNIDTVGTVTGFISSEMNRLKEDSIWDYRALVLLCMMNNHINKNIFRKTTHSHDKLLRQLFIESGERVSLIKEKIERSLSFLVGKFTKYCNSEYTFRYDWLFDYVAHFVGKENVELVIEYSDSAFIRDKVILQKKFLSGDENNNLFIKISHDLKEAYEKRLLLDLKGGYFWNVISSCHSRLQEFEMILHWFQNYGCKIKDISNHSTAIHIASSLKCLDLVNALIEIDKSKINATDWRQKTPLYYACLMGYVKITHLLVSNNPEAKEPSRWTDTDALYIACANQHYEVVKLLLTYMKIKSRSCVDSPLHITCENGNTDIMQLLISHNAPVNHVHDSLSPLHIAAFNGHIDIVKILLSKNISVNADHMSISPLCMAASNGHKEIVDLLLQKYAAVNTYVEGSLTPIFSASRNGHADIVEVLLKNKALVDTRYGDMTSLGVACLELHENVTDVLLRHKANIENCKNNSSALHLICKTSSSKDKKSMVQKLLKENIDINKFDFEQNTALDYTLGNSDLEIAGLLIKNGATVNHATGSGRFPLLVASRNGQELVVEFLLKNDTKVDMKNSDGNTALNDLCSSWTRPSKDHPHGDLSDPGQQCFSNIIKMLLKNNADVNECNKNGYSPLTSACNTGKSYCIPLLLKHDLSLLDKLDRNGKTPLYIACLSYHKRVVDCLLKYEANVNQQCSDGATAIHAILLSRQETANQNTIFIKLVENGADVNLADNENKSVLHFVCERNDRIRAEILLRKNPKLNIKTLKGFTPLHLSCYNGHCDMLACLLDYLTNTQNTVNSDGHYDSIASNTKGDNASIINESDNEGNTPLHIACVNGNTRIAEMLLRAGADVDKLNKDKRTPLYLACQRGSEAVVQLLLQSKANTNLACCKGWTALHVSCSNSNEELVRLLLQNGADKSIKDVNGFTAREIAFRHTYKDIVEFLS